jgi:D-alanyl-D-alanine carboxypeptidase
MYDFGSRPALDDRPPAMQIKPTLPQRSLDRLVTLGAIGAAASVQVGGKSVLALAAGHATLDRRLALTPDHLFQIGSQTKMFMATATLQLVREGRLGLDEPIVELLAGRDDIAALSGGRRITVRHLLNHSSGFGNYTDLMKAQGWFGIGWPPVDYTDAELLLLARTLGLQFLPGERVRYSNTNFVVLGQIIAAVTGKSAPQVITERILAPLGLHDTHFGRTGSWPRERAAQAALVPAHGGNDGQVLDVSALPTVSWAAHAGDLISSMDQLLRFQRALADPAKPLGVGLEDLTQAPVPMSEPHTRNGYVDLYGFGCLRFMFNGRPWWGHTGGTLAYRSITVIDPSLDAAFSCHATYTSSAAGAGEIEALMAQKMALCAVLAAMIETAAAGL